MRCLVIVKANKESEAGVMPTTELLSEMGEFNEELAKAGVMQAGEGLHPSSKGKRVQFSGGKTKVIDGPFAETKELIAGYWIWKVGSVQEAVDWLKRSPFRNAPDAEVEVRPIFEAEDFGAELTPELRAHEKRLRTEIEKHKAS
jgi:hypothetical protein